MNDVDVAGLSPIANFYFDFESLNKLPIQGF